MKKDKTIRFYNVISIAYPIIDFCLKNRKEVLRKELNKLPKGKLLEIGVGIGNHLQMYKHHNFTGVDFSKSMISKAKKDYPDLSLFVMDGCDLEFENTSFDYVVLSHVISINEKPLSLLEEAIRVLKPNGRIFILNHFTPDNWTKHIDWLLNPFAKLFHFRSYFKRERIDGIHALNWNKEITFGIRRNYQLLIAEKA